jgi:hypothetical protein
MMPLRARLRAPWNLTVVFLAVAGVSVLALVWLGFAIVRQDRAIEIQRLNEQREAAADRSAAALERALSADERLLDNTASPPEGFAGDDAILIAASASGLRA